MLLTKVLHLLFVQFSVNFRPSVPPKSRFSLERVVDFEVFRMFLPTTLFNTFSSQFWTLWGSFWELWRSFWAPFHASWGVLRPLLPPSSILLPQKPVLKANFWTPNCPKSPQDTSKAAQNRPKSTLAAHLELQNRRKSTKMIENQPKSMKINHNQSKSIEIKHNPPKSMKIDRSCLLFKNLKSMKIKESSKINENQQKSMKSMKINEKQRWSTKINHKPQDPSRAV